VHLSKQVLGCRMDLPASEPRDDGFLQAGLQKREIGSRMEQWR